MTIVFDRKRRAGEALPSDGDGPGRSGLQGERLQHLRQQPDLSEPLAARHPPRKVSRDDAVGLSSEEESF